MTGAESNVEGVFTRVRDTQANTASCGKPLSGIRPHTRGNPAVGTRHRMGPHPPPSKHPLTQQVRPPTLALSPVG